MVRFYIGTAILLVSLTANAQTTPAGSVPPPIPALSTAAPTARAAATPSSNPFAPRAETATVPATNSGVELPPPPPPPPTEQSVRAKVELAYRTNGARVGRVNGQTFFKLDKDYLFVPTGLEDAQPVVSEKPIASAPTAQSVPIVRPAPGVSAPVTPSAPATGARP